MKMTIPAPNTWINSCLVGSNAYRLLSTDEEYCNSFLEEDVDDIWRTGAEQRFARVKRWRDKGEALLVFFDMTSERMHDLADVMESVHAYHLNQKGFFWPLDLVWHRTPNSNIKGYIALPFDRRRFYPIRKALLNADAPRWELSKSIFNRVKELHRCGLTMNGFSREQVRVDEETNEVYLCPNEYLTKITAIQADHRESSFLAIPTKIEKRIKECNKQLSGPMRDVFSAAVLSFYLLFYTHPFVGSAYYALMRDQYMDQYQNYPVYIFDPSGNNPPGNLAMGREIQGQWERTQPALKKMFNAAFVRLSYPESAKWIEHDPDWLDIDKWLEYLEEDAVENDNENSRSKYPFETEWLHRV